MTRDEKIKEKRIAYEKANEEYTYVLKYAVDDPLPIDWQKELSRPRLCEVWNEGDSREGTSRIMVIRFCDGPFLWKKGYAGWNYARLLTDDEIDAYKGGPR